MDGKSIEIPEFLLAYYWKALLLTKLFSCLTTCPISFSIEKSGITCKNYRLLQRFGSTIYIYIYNLETLLKNCHANLESCLSARRFYILGSISKSMIRFKTFLLGIFRQTLTILVPRAKSRMKMENIPLPEPKNLLQKSGVISEGSIFSNKFSKNN